MENEEQGPEVDAFRKSIARRIALESDRLVDELFAIVYDPETEAKVRLSAINTLLDRGIPKLGIQHTKDEEIEERGSRKQLRDEIEELMKKKLNNGDDDDDDGLAGVLAGR